MIRRMEAITSKVIHAAKIFPQGGFIRYLLLRQEGEDKFRWYEWDQQEEKDTPISAITLEEAIRQGRLYWKMNAFRTVNCGFRYTLPERDEHGLNALFHQMVASYNSPNGVYFDADLGNNCFVNFASEEARNLWKTLKNANRL